MKWFHFAGVWFAFLRAEQAILAAEPKAMAGLTEEMKQLPAAECMHVMQGHATLCKWQYSVLLNCIIFYIILHKSPSSYSSPFAVSLHSKLIPFVSIQTFLRFIPSTPSMVQGVQHFSMKNSTLSCQLRPGFRRVVPLQNNHRPLAIWCALSYSSLGSQTEAWKSIARSETWELGVASRSWKRMFVRKAFPAGKRSIQSITGYLEHRSHGLICFICSRGATLENSEYLAAKADFWVSPLDFSIVYSQHSCHSPVDPRPKSNFCEDCTLWDDSVVSYRPMPCWEACWSNTSKTELILIVFKILLSRICLQWQGSCHMFLGCSTAQAMEGECATRRAWKLEKSF